MGGTTRPYKAEIFDDVEAIAQRFTDRARDARFIALSRPTPSDVFARVRLPERAEVFQADERDAPEGSDDRNATLIERALAPKRFHPMSDAETYEKILVERIGDPPVFDLVHLGLGPDGHTASLLPGDPVLDEDERWVAKSGPAGGFDRITLTFPTLRFARSIVFVVTGEAKADAVARVFAEDPEVPASRLEADFVVFLLDEAAASRL